MWCQCLHSNKPSAPVGPNGEGETGNDATPDPDTKLIHHHPRHPLAHHFLILAYGFFFSSWIAA